jgi:hypothetical protein
MSKHRVSRSIVRKSEPTFRFCAMSVVRSRVNRQDPCWACWLTWGTPQALRVDHPAVWCPAWVWARIGSLYFFVGWAELRGAFLVDDGAEWSSFQTWSPPKIVSWRRRATVGHDTYVPFTRRWVLSTLCWWLVTCTVIISGNFDGIKLFFVTAKMNVEKDI